MTATVTDNTIPLPATPAISMWGMVVLVAPLMSSVLIFRYRNHASRAVLGG